MNTTPRDEFLSAEDLDLANLSDEELDRIWTDWLRQAQATNDEDRREYSHGVFAREPPWTDRPEASAGTHENESPTPAPPAGARRRITGAARSETGSSRARPAPGSPR